MLGLEINKIEFDTVIIMQTYLLPKTPPYTPTAVGGRGVKNYFQSVNCLVSYFRVLVGFCFGGFFGLSKSYLVFSLVSLSSFSKLSSIVSVFLTAERTRHTSYCKVYKIIIPQGGKSH